jgi:hypothetical protein
MKATYTTRNGRLSVDLEAETHTKLWSDLASFKEVFEETNCKKCDSENIKFVVRKSKDAKGKTFDY